MDYPDRDTFDKEVEERKKLASEVSYVKSMLETMKNESHVLLTKLTNLLDGAGGIPSLAVQIDRLVNSNSLLHARVTGLEEREKEREKNRHATVQQLIVRVLGGFITLFGAFIAGLWYSNLGT